MSAPAGYGGLFDTNDVVSTTPNYYFTYEDEGITEVYGYGHGTSISAAHVSGVAALILSVSPGLLPSTTRGILQSSADDLGLPGLPGWDRFFGSGRVNAYRALKFTLEHYGGTVARTLEIPSGEQWTFSPNCRLLIQGALSASNVTFTSSSSPWFGIEFFGTGNGNVLTGCTIENAEFGVFAHETNGLQISYCTIQNNSTGVFSSGTMQVLAHNYITGNTTGVNCVDYSDADFEINNWIKYNSTGIAIDATSTPWLGTTQFPTYCSIWGNDWDIWSTYSGTVYAEMNYWGDYPANPMIYGSVDYSNELSSEPSMKVPAFLVTKHATVSEPGKESSLIDTAGIGELDAIRKLDAHTQSDVAQSAYRSIVVRYAANLSGEIALVRLETSLEKQSIDPEDMLRSYAQTYKGTTLGDLANLRLAHFLIRSGHTEEALDLCLSIADAAGKFEREALYDAGSLLWYRMNNTTEAERYYRRLIKKFPKDPSALSALATLGDSPIKDHAAKGSTLESAPTAFSVAEPYPNPFNPSTQINFALPEASNVTLVVYDILGRQVAVLACDFFTAGNHSAKWDGSSVASGIYYARLTVTDDIGNVKYAKVNKLLLMK